MVHRKYEIRFITVLALIFCFAASPAFAQNRSTRQIKVAGVTNLSAQPGSAPTEIGNEVFIGPEVDEQFTKPQITGSISPSRVSSAHVPTPAGSAFASAAGDVFLGFNAISHRDQRLSNNGNQFSLEPPDQGLAVGGGFVVEAVNDAVRIFDSTGTALTGTVALSSFLGLPPEIDRSKTPVVFGPEPTDPRVYFDATTLRFFLTSLVLSRKSDTGALIAPVKIYIAVSQTADPTGNWTILTLDVTNDGGPFAACPCFGDQPLIGADANGIYISTNGFSLSTFSFSGANIYAFSKAALETASAGAITAVRFSNLTEAGLPFAFTIQPATVPPGGSFATNTEYFVSALDFTNTVDNRLVVWALTGTDTLGTATPTLSLVNAVVDTQSYGAPPQAQQKPGPFPLGTLLKDHEELVSSNDDRMEQVVFADGKLWTALSTSAKTLNGPVRTAAAWFILSPAVSGGAVSASVVNQGYIAINDPNQQNVLFPSVAVNSSGKGVVAFSVVGTNYFPSAGYAPIDVNGTGAIRISGAGAFPEDGFSGYAQFRNSNRVARWGDYSAAVSDENGTIWMGNEYIPNAPRTVNANWGTFIGGFTPQ
jgi:hypothetical protein